MGVVVKGEGSRGEGKVCGEGRGGEKEKVEFVDAFVRAGDGIRSRVRSRGLGGVYKTQSPVRFGPHSTESDRTRPNQTGPGHPRSWPVTYTHPTTPPNIEAKITVVA